MSLLSIINNPSSFEQPPYIIAEAGVNHNGNLEMAKELIKVAKKCGADCVKFQTFKAENVASFTAQKADYQKENTDSNESQFNMLKKLELNFDDFKEIQATCQNEGITFLSTPYSLEDVELLESLNVEAYKIASGQTVEYHFLYQVAKKAKPIIISSGMCTLAEIDEAIRTIRDACNEEIILLQCTTNYPSNIKDANLRTIPTMQEAFAVPVGYSDHTTCNTSAIVATALGAKVIERHFTLDKTLPGPDHQSSSDPQELKYYIEQIHEAWLSLGSKQKFPSKIEKENIPKIRRGIVASANITTSEILSEKNVTVKRPLEGCLPASYFPLILGKRAKKDIKADTPILFEDIQ